MCPPSWTLLPPPFYKGTNTIHEHYTLMTWSPHKIPDWKHHHIEDYFSKEEVLKDTNIQSIADVF